MPVLKVAPRAQESYHLVCFHRTITIVNQRLTKNMQSLACPWYNPYFSSSKTRHMTTAAKSVYYFGLYLYATGCGLLLVPNKFLGLFLLPETNEVWIRVAGILVICIGYYYHRTGAGNIKEMLRLTVHARCFVFLAFLALVVLKYAAIPLAGFGIVDLLGALWTWAALKKEK